MVSYSRIATGYNSDLNKVISVSPGGYFATQIGDIFRVISRWIPCEEYHDESTFLDLLSP